MKTLVSLLIVFLIPFISNAQSQDWKQIESPFETSIYIVHQTSQGYLFGKMNYTNQVFFSNDRGQSWRQLPDKFGENYRRTFIVREDINGNLFHASNGSIGSFDPISLNIQYIFIVDYYDLEDFAILNSGNFVVATSRKLNIYSPSGTLMHQHEWWTHSAQFLLDREGQKHFVTNSIGATDKIVEFNDDLSYVSDPKSLDIKFNIIRNGNRLFRENSFSEDGMTWQSLNFQSNPTISAFNAGHDGRLFFISQDQLFISTNNGNSFNQVDMPLDRANYISSSHSGEIVTSEQFLNTPLFYVSQNAGINWQLVNHEMGLPYMLDFTAGINENLFTDNILSYYDFSYKTNEWTPWQEEDYLPGSYFRHFESISDGSTLAFTNQGELYETNNYGADWQLRSDQDFGRVYDWTIQEKAGVLYYIDRQTMHFSQDFGYTWETLIMQDPQVITSFQEDILPAINFGAFFLTQDINFSEVLMYYNFLSGEKVVTPRVSNIYPYATSHNETILYGLKYEQGMLFLSVSNDQGVTFSDKLIEGLNIHNVRKIKTDHLNNIYVYTEKQLFYTDDEGETWIDITPDFPDLFRINDLQVSFDNYIYISTVGMGILKFKNQLAIPRTLTVKIVDDQNKNCTVDLNEPALKGLKVSVNDTYLRPLDEMGEAIFLTHSTLNEVKVIYNSDLFQDCESSYTVEFEDTDTELHLDIPLKVINYCADPVVGLSVPFLRRCFDNTYSGSVCNEGNIESINTEIELILDPFFDFISATLPIKSINGQIIVLDAGHLQPGECHSFHFVVNISCNSDLGQEHCISAYTSTGSVDCEAVPARDAYMDCQENIGAYDPNDKNIFVNGNRNQSYIEPGDKIEYLIRFQNTGTDTAFTVRIEDPITKKFNISSLKPVAASHDYTWSVNNGMLVVLFEDIQLVDSFKNEPASHGFIKFEIQLDSLTLRGDDVKNLAGIFFDFNEPIITEEVFTVIGQPLNTKELYYESITAFPNPANGLVYISGSALSDKPQDLMIYDIHGKLIQSQKISHFNNTIDISKCTPGTYMLMMKSGEKVYRGKVVKM